MAYFAYNVSSGIQDPCMQTDPTQHISSRKDCYFFVHLGSCWYGPYCRFNHPAGQANAPDDQEGSNGNVSKSRKIPCKYFTSGYCKYGMWCQFDHSMQAFVRDPKLHYNSLGFPFRPGRRDCSYYLRTYGHCAYGPWCKFNHPEFDYDDELEVDYYDHESFSSYANGEALEYQNGSFDEIHGGGFSSMQSEDNSSQSEEPKSEEPNY